MNGSKQIEDYKNRTAYAKSNVNSKHFDHSSLIDESNKTYTSFSTVYLDEIPALFLDSASVQLKGSPFRGYYSVTGESNSGLFTPVNAKIGNNQVTYHSGGCTASITIQVEQCEDVFQGFRFDDIGTERLLEITEADAEYGFMIGGISPNPSFDEFILNDISDSEYEMNYTILNPLGEFISTGKNEIQSAKNNITIGVNDLPGGTCFIQIDNFK